MLESFDYPADKITIVQNAIDTVSLQKSYKEVNEEIITGLKQELGIVGDNVGIYCGGMYPEKRLDFILEVIGKVKSEVSDFHMIFIGSGIDSGKIEIAAKNTSWIHYVGPKFGNDRVKYFKIASLQLMPGLVGLGILDSFALETPIITTEYPYHSPEIEYLSNNVNGIITKNTLEEYTNAIISLFKSKKHLQLIEECRKSAGIYTVEAMVDNFKMGIVKCLEG
jgi:glycosyltransferase involved in cell wall biosynthesis